MKVFKVLLGFMLALVLASGAAYGAGHLARHPDRRTVAAVPRLTPASVHPRPAPIDAPAPTDTPPPGTPPATVPPTPAPTQVAPPPRPVAVLRPGATGTRVRELQQRLSQLAWLPATTTGVYDRATITAVEGFQAKHGLTRSGVLDRRTWGRLVALTEKPGHDAMFNVLHPGRTLLGSGSGGTDVRALQARLKQLDWYAGDVTGVYDAATVSAVRGFQGKRGIPVTGAVDQRTLDRLESMTTTPSHDEMHNILPSPGRLDPRCLTGRVLCIDKTSRTLRWVIDGKVLQTMDARFGSTVNNTPTREGLFHVFLKDADHVSTLYGSSMPFSMFFSGGEAVHYSSDFATYGYAGASHGCVNIRDYNGIKWLFSQVRVGDKVVVYWS